MATASTYTLLQRVTTNTPTASVTFSSIPQTGYTDLKVVVSGRSTTSNPGYARFALYMAINGSSTTFTGKDLLGFGSEGTNSNGYSTGRSGFVDANDATANIFSITEIYIPNYTSSNNKSFSVDFATENNAANQLVQGIAANLWSTTTAISSLTFTVELGYLFSADSTFSLYGMSAVGTSPGTPKALGGDIVVNDGSFWYHAFLNSGTFAPFAALSCDVLVVAGGGSGGSRNGVGGAGGGGGGAGGLRLIASQALTASASYVATVGAGGVTPIAANTYTRGTSGTNSSFAGAGITTIATSGGGAGGIVNAPPLTGGSGGGGGGGAGANATGASGNSGSYSPVEGYGGGNGNTDNSGGGVPYPGGGGGGAGGAGTNYSGSTPGTGGAGVSSYNSISFSAWLTATKTGDSGVMSKGGNGATWTTPAAPANSGVMNTGGGGNAAGQSNGGSGGSGIIIIRYAV
jgi:hypothetical protein